MGRPQCQFLLDFNLGRQGGQHLKLSLTEDENGRPDVRSELGWDGCFVGFLLDADHIVLGRTLQNDRLGNLVQEDADALIQRIRRLAAGRTVPDSGHGRADVEASDQAEDGQQH